MCSASTLLSASHSPRHFGVRAAIARVLILRSRAPPSSVAAGRRLPRGAPRDLGARRGARLARRAWRARVAGRRRLRLDARGRWRCHRTEGAKERERGGGARDVSRGRLSAHSEAGAGPGAHAALGGCRFGCGRCALSLKEGYICGIRGIPGGRIGTRASPCILASLRPLGSATPSAVASLARWLEAPRKATGIPNLADNSAKRARTDNTKIYFLQSHSLFVCALSGDVGQQGDQDRLARRLQPTRQRGSGAWRCGPKLAQARRNACRGALRMRGCLHAFQRKNGSCQPLVVLGLEVRAILTNGSLPKTTCWEWCLQAWQLTE